MQTEPHASHQDTHARHRRHNERGAALITALLISALLLSAGGALILTTAMSGTNSVSATAEMQAYYAAEAGLQQALDILRFNVDAPAGTPAGLDGTTNASFRNAAGTNLGTWLQLPCADATRCTYVGTTPVIRVGTRAAYSIAVSDPDNIAPPSVPTRLRVVVTGYGPNGARKVLDAMLLPSGLAGYSASSPVTLIGASDPLAIPHASFASGHSSNLLYSGVDAAKPTDPGYDPARAGNRPAFSTTPTGVGDVTGGIEKPTDQVEGIVNLPVGTLGDGTNGTLSTPSWLSSAAAARQFLEDMRTITRPNKDKVTGLPIDTADDRYFTSAMQPPASNVSGITFIEGNATLGPNNQGSGLLIVTGNLSMNGGTDFTGLILVLGQGTVTRSGGGGGRITGGIVVARFGATGDFLTPSFNDSGGGNSRIQFNSAAVNNAASAVPGFMIAGVVEK